MSKPNEIYKCRFKGCSHISRSKTSLGRHAKSHSKLIRVSQHVRIKCPLCEWKGSDGVLRKHINKNHPELKDTPLK